MKSLRRFRATILAMLALLVLQFVAGMFANLYVGFPEPLPTAEGWTWAFAHTLVVPFHVLLGSLVLVLSLAAIELGWWASSRAAIVAAVTGFLCLALAYLCGMWFLTYGQSDVSSFLMALAFMAAFVVYATGFHATRPQAGAAPSGRA